MTAPASSRFVIAAFLAMLAAPPLVQVAVEARRGEWPQAGKILTRQPTQANLRAFEKALEQGSLTVRSLRPWVQAAQFFGLREAGAKALAGRDGWLFYLPGVSFLTQRPQARESTVAEALRAVVRFRDELATRGIRLLLLPAPNKESIYPDQLSRLAAPPTRVIGSDTRAFLAGCEAAGVEVVDLFALYRSARDHPQGPLYLTQDSHWSPWGMERAAVAVAGRILERGWLSPGSMRYQRRPAPIQRPGDVVRMLDSPPIEQRVPPESVQCTQVVLAQDTSPYADNPASEVLVLGDSFLRIFQQDEPGSAGFVAHLAHALGRPLASIINDGGASTLVRQELFRRPHLLAHARVVVWEFVERDLRLGTEGWQFVPLPPPPPPDADQPQTTRPPA